MIRKYKTVIILTIILLLAAFFRLYKISDYMTFLGDEGRDVLVAKGILEGHFTLLGPRASAGDFYLGPIYYYMMAPFLWLFQLDPVGPAVMVALLSVVTTWLVYFVGKKFFDTKTGIYAAALYAVSPLVIAYAHSSWNPNVVPFFSLLLIYITYLAVAKPKQKKYFVFAGFILGIALQLHYLTLFLGVVVALYILIAGRLQQQRFVWLQLLRQYGLVFAGFIVGFSPFLAFEARHGFPNIRTIFGFIFGDTLQKSYETQASYLSTVGSVFFRIFSRLVFNFPTPDRYHLYASPVLIGWGFVAMAVSIFAIVWLWKSKNKFIVLLLYLWLFVSVLLFGLYKKPIYDYYFVFVFPLPFLLIGNLLSGVAQFKKKKLWYAVSVILFIGLFLINLKDQPFQYGGNRQKDQAKQIAEFVISKTDNKPYNFALISKGNSDHEYRYFLEILHHKPVTIENMLNDPQRKSVTGQLLIVCEDITCQPLGYPLFDVASFGRAEIVNSWNVSVVKVYKLKHFVEKK